jgi:tetratricopeptide (TPR) repeat protein
MHSTISPSFIPSRASTPKPLRFTKTCLSNGASSWGPEHPRTLARHVEPRASETWPARLAGAETLGHLVLEIRARALGAEHSDTLESQNILASIFEEEGKYAEADPLFTRVIEVRQRVLGPRNPDTLESIAHLGELRIDQARYAEAEATLRGCLDIQKQTMPSDYRRYLTETLLGASLAGDHKYVEAEPLLVGGYEGMKQNAAAVSDLNRQKMKKVGEPHCQVLRAVEQA